MLSELAIYIIAGVANGALYALMALGLILIYKTQSFVPFVNGEFFAAGAFLGFTAFQVVALPYWLVFPLAIAGGMLLGLITERVVVRPIATTHHLSLVMVTVGASITLQGVARIFWGDNIYSFPAIFSGQSIDVLGVPVALQNLAIVVVTGVLTAALFLFFSYTRLGKQTRALSENRDGAQIVGIDPHRIYRVTWGLSAGVGAATGILAAPITLLYPDMGTGILIKGFAAAILGGLNSIPGGIIGGIVIGISEMLIGGYVDTAFIEISAFIVIMAVLLIRPQGLLGTKELGRV